MAAEGGAASREAVFGVLSLILWALILIVILKYVVVLLRADNNGEGGTLTLMALARRVSAHGATILYFGIIGASLLRRADHAGYFRVVGNRRREGRNRCL